MVGMQCFSVLITFPRQMISSKHDIFARDKSRVNGGICVYARSLLAGWWRESGGLEGEIESFWRLILCAISSFGEHTCRVIVVLMEEL